MLSQIPGPRPLPVVGNALDILQLPLSELMLSYARKHGPFVRFSILNDVLHLASDPRILHHINVANSRNYLDRWTPPGFEVLLYSGTIRGLVFSQRKYWMQHRSLVASAFRTSGFVASFVDVTAAHTNYLMRHVWRHKLGQSVNVHQSMRMLTLDVIGSAVLGVHFGAMAAGHHAIEQSLSNILSGVMDVIKSPLPLWRFMNTPGRAIVQMNLNRLQKIERNLIRDRRARLKEGDGEKDLLAMLLRAKDKKESSFFRDEDLMWDVHDIIFAGHETTASALAASIFLVSGSPRVQKKIRQELNSVLPNREMPTLKSISRLQYLDMVINEALRLYPPTALVGRIAKEKDVIAGYQIEKGANILMSPYVMGRLEQIWDNPLEFRPERFLPQNISKRHPMSHTPFGAGPRVCLGARLALVEAKVVLAILFQHYSFERSADELVVDYDSTVSFKKGMDMKIRQLKV